MTGPVRWQSAAPCRRSPRAESSTSRGREAPALAPWSPLWSGAPSCASRSPPGDRLRGPALLGSGGSDTAPLFVHPVGALREHLNGLNLLGARAIDLTHRAPKLLDPLQDRAEP